ncbi:MAG: multicopper oxidase family protein [Alphaproteobacteria bacterium]|nr:multicopper oxidase family protein [Alphaproteobacteria bacterium]
MNRRKLLISAASIGGVGALAWYASRTATMKSMPGMDMAGGDMPGMNMGNASEKGGRVRELPTGSALPEIPRLKNDSGIAGNFIAQLEAATASHSFVPGLVTPVLAYNGSVPGAMIEVYEGDQLSIAFKNSIPGQASTIHWHGLDIPADQDGNPTHPVESGTGRTYAFTIPAGSAGSYWYHPHPHGLTAEQVYRGLAAPFIVRSKNDPLDAKLGDTVLFVSSISLNSDGTIAENTAADRFNGREGDHVLVNGAKQPVLSVQPGASRRYRIYNATNGRYLRIALDGHKMTLVGTDGGLLAAPIRNLEEILLAPAERAEVVIDFQNKTGRFALNSMPYERGWMGRDKPAATILPLMTFEVAGASVSSIAVPEKLRDIAPLGEPASVKRIVLNETMGMANGAMTMEFLIDQKSFDMNRVDLRSKVGEVELWEISNTTDMDHPLHIHGTQFQVVEREINGSKKPQSFLAWKDTVNIVSKEIVRLKVRHSLPGLRMYHCHILEHEDNGMMGQLDVV